MDIRILILVFSVCLHSLVLLSGITKNLILREDNLISFKFEDNFYAKLKDNFSSIKGDVLSFDFASLISGIYNKLIDNLLATQQGQLLFQALLFQQNELKIRTNISVVKLYKLF